MNQPVLDPQKPQSLSELQVPDLRFSMPARMVFFRHGQSDANAIVKAIESGILKEYPANFHSIPDREFRLSSLGRNQAQKTGPWIAKQYPAGFDRIYVSDHTRARETCGHVCLAAGWKDVQIESNPFLGERNWGRFALQPQERRDEIMKYRKIDPLHNPMPDGETMLQARHRAIRILEKSARQDKGLNVLYFTHGEFIESIWAEIEDMDTDRQVAFFHPSKEDVKDLDGDIKNCQVIEFSSINPFDPNDIVGKLRWVRSSCPWAGIEGEWRSLEKRRFTPEQLIARAEQYPQLSLPPITENLVPIEKMPSHQ